MFARSKCEPGLSFLVYRYQGVASCGSIFLLIFASPYPPRATGFSSVLTSQISLFLADAALSKYPDSLF